MRYALLASMVMVAGVPAALAQEAPPADVKIGITSNPAVKRTVYLDNLVLEDLKKTNPRHYAEAMRVMAASDELCAPGALQMWQVLQLPPGHCHGEFLKTSYPPKRQISFHLDDTLYIALVTIKEARPEFQRLGQVDGVRVDTRPIVEPAR